MWRKLVVGFIVVPLGVVLIALAVANRKPVQLTLDPFGALDPTIGLQAPLFLLLLGAFALRVDRGRHRHLVQSGQVAEDGTRRRSRGTRLAPPGRPAGEGA